DRTAMRRAHAYDAAYLHDVAHDDDMPVSPSEMSPEFSRHFRGLRLWLPLLVHGVAPFRACLQEKLLLTRYFHNRVAELGFEVGPEPELSVATYRYVPERGDANAFNQALLDAIHADGRVFVSSTTLGGQLTLRMAALVFRSHLDSIDLLLDILASSVERLASTD
ncbi:MAG: amino acid decarboxylase, partial [Myxococcota bacterium]